MNRQTVIAAFLVLLVGCTHTRQFSNYDEINSVTRGKVVKIRLSDGNFLKAKDIKIMPDSTFWFEPDKGSKQAISTSQINELVLVNRGRGAWEGFRPFLIAGGILGLIGLASGDDPGAGEPGWEGFFAFSAGEKAALGLSLGVGYGVVFGLPIGAAIGSKDKYILHNKDLLPKVE